MGFQGLTVMLEFHILRGRREQMGSLSFMHAASLREYLKYSCFLSNSRNCLWGMSTYKVFSEALILCLPFIPYIKTSNFLCPPLFCPCIPDTQVWLTVLFLQETASMPSHGQRTPTSITGGSPSPYCLHFFLWFFILNKSSGYLWPKAAKRLFSLLKLLVVSFHLLRRGSSLVPHLRQLKKNDSVIFWTRIARGDMV